MSELSNRIAMLGLTENLDIQLTSAEKFISEAHAPATLRAYEADAKKYRKWCVTHRIERTLQSDPAVVAVYLSHMAGLGRKLATIERASKGVAYDLRTDGKDWDGGYLVRDVLAGIRNGSDTTTTNVTKKTPINIDDLIKLISAVADPRDRVLLTLGWHGAFRRSELVGLNVEDVTFTVDGMSVHVRRSKEDQAGLGANVGIPFSRDAHICPVRLLRAHIGERTNGPLFLTKIGGAGHRLGAQMVSRIVKQAAYKAGLDPQVMAAHSLRSGFATAASAAGKSVASIVKHGRWRNADVALGYVRPTNEFEDNAAKDLT